MRIISTLPAAAVMVFATLPQTASGSFKPLTQQQRVAAASVIAVLEVKQVDENKGLSKAVVIEPLLGTKAGAELEIWDAWETNGNGIETRISGRDAYLQVGKRYLVYLNKNKRDRLVTLQSCLDCLEVEGDKILKQDRSGYEPLDERLKSIRALLEHKAKPTPSDSKKPPRPPREINEPKKHES